MTNELNEKRWHRAFSVQRQLALIDAARQHDPLKDFPGKIMFDTIRTLSEICDEQEARIVELEEIDAEQTATIEQMAKDC